MIMHLLITLVSLVHLVVAPPASAQTLRPPQQEPLSPSKLEQLCRATDYCRPDPVITGVSSDSTITQGGGVRILGSGFGNAPGRLYLAGYELSVDTWNDNSVIGIIPEITVGPPGAGGVCDNPSLPLYLIDRTGLRVSNSFPVAFRSQPRIHTLVGNVTPGGQVLIAGCGFGNPRGTLLLGGLRTPAHEVNVNKWFDHADYGTVIDGTVPEITGVMDTPVWLNVVTSAGRPAKPWPVMFKATRVVQGIRTAPPLAIDSCKDLDSRNFCFAGGAAASLPFSFGGWHQGWYFGSSGTDVFSVTLINGWVLQSFSKLVLGSGSASDPRGFTPGSRSATLSVDWSYPVTVVKSADVLYTIDLIAIGPKGLPFR